MLAFSSIVAACDKPPAAIGDAGVDSAQAVVIDLAPYTCPPAPTFSNIRTKILSECGGGSCHQIAPFAGNLDLTNANAYASLVGVPAKIAPSLVRVKPGVPLDSFLWHKLDDELPIDGSQGGAMPLGAENFWFPLSADQRALVYCWIQAGALND